MTLLVYDPIFLEHDTGYHPESPARLRAITAHLEAEGLRARCEVVSPRPATEDEVALVHARAYIRRVRAIAEAGGGALDLETPVSARTYQAALMAVGAGLSACDRITQAGAGTAFCAVRPPGHHACPDRGMGFCIFNTVAVAARYLTRHLGLERVLIVDWDVHHGNGTQAAFYDDPTVHYLSLHRMPFYPGTGAAAERGRGAGEGRTTNVPLPAWTAAPQYTAAFVRALDHIVAEFKPQFILVSAGFDAHRADPIGGLGLSEDDFGLLTREVIRAAASSGPVRIVSVLEGGYDLTALPRCAAAHLRALLESHERG